MSIARLPSELIARVDGDAVVAPRIGWWRDPPASGTLVGPGSPLGTLQCLGRSFELRLADGVAGHVREVPRLRVVPVEYGQVLFRLEKFSGVGEQASARARAADDAGSELAVVAPTDGVFYRRLAPDAAPFVEVGSSVTVGQPVGMIEVMKTFNQILYGGSGLPDKGVVREIRCDDAAEVRAGEVLLVVSSGES